MNTRTPIVMALRLGGFTPDEAEAAVESLANELRREAADLLHARACQSHANGDHRGEYEWRGAADYLDAHHNDRTPHRCDGPCTSGARCDPGSRANRAEQMRHDFALCGITVQSYQVREEPQ